MEAARPAELHKTADDEMEFSSDSSVGSEPEVEITGASGPPPSAALRRKTYRAVKKIQLSKVGFAAAQQMLMTSTRKGASKVRGGGKVGSVLTGPRVEVEATQSLGRSGG